MQKRRIFVEHEGEIGEFDAQHSVRLRRALAEHLRADAGGGELGDRLVHRFGGAGGKTAEPPLRLRKDGGDRHDRAVLGKHSALARKKARERGDLRQERPARGREHGALGEQRQPVLAEDEIFFAPRLFFRRVLSEKGERVVQRGRFDEPYHAPLHIFS